MKTYQTIRQIWNAQPLSEKVFAVGFAFIAPVMLGFLMAILP